MVRLRPPERITIRLLAILLVPGLLVAGLVLVLNSDAGDVVSDIGIGLISGAATSAAFFVVGWSAQRASDRRERTSQLTSSIVTQLVDLRGATQEASFFIQLNHSGPTYRDCMRPLIGGVSVLEANLDLVDHADPALNNKAQVTHELNEVSDSLRRLAAEFAARYRGLSRIAEIEPKNTDRHRKQLATFDVLVRELAVDLSANGESRLATRSPLTDAINRAISALRASRPT
jgi:hypothetical protein